MAVKTYKMFKGTVVHIHGIPFELVEDALMSTEENNMALAQEHNDDCAYCGHPRVETNHDMLCDGSHGEMTEFRKTKDIFGNYKNPCDNPGMHKPECECGGEQ